MNHHAAKLHGDAIARNENQGGSVNGTEVALVSNTHERPLGAPGCFATGESLLREKEARRLFARKAKNRFPKEWYRNI